MPLIDRGDTPAALAAEGFRLRDETEGDVAFLERLYLDVRSPELAQIDWSDDVKHAFLIDQHRLQRHHYRTHHGDAAFRILEHDGAAVGRLYIHRSPEDVRIVDISLLSGARGKGVGGRLLEALLTEAEAMGATVSIHVEQFNPAQTLYRRLGFEPVRESGPYWLMERRPAPVEVPA